MTVFGDGEQTRDFVFVDDVVDAFVRAATRGGGLVCNVGTGRETSVNELLATMAQQAGTEVTPVMAPPRPGELLRSSLDIERAAIQLGLAALDRAGRRGTRRARVRARPPRLRRISGRGPRPAAGRPRPAPRRGATRPRARRARRQRGRLGPCP